MTQSNKRWNPKTVPDEFQAFLVRDAFFTSNEEYPILRKDMVPVEPPRKIIPFEKAINCHGDLSNTFICTFSPDRTFKRILLNPRKYVKFFKRTAGIIGFDFSIHGDMPMIKQKGQINDNLSLTYYYGKLGIPIIPNIRCGSDELLPEFLQAIPKESMVAIGTHGFIKHNYEKYEWRNFLDQVLPILKPSKLIVYGTLNGPLFDDIKDSIPVLEYEPWSTTRRKEALNDN